MFADLDLAAGVLGELDLVVAVGLARPAALAELVEHLHAAREAHAAAHLLGEVQDVVVADELEELEARAEPSAAETTKWFFSELNRP